MRFWREITIAVLLGIVAVLGYCAYSAHEAALKADAENAGLEAQRQQVKVETAREVVQVKAERKKADTPQKQIEYIERTIPIHLSMPNFELGKALPPELPEHPVVMPHTDLPAITDFAEQFNVQVVELKGCRKELCLCNQQVKALEKGNGKGFGSRKFWFTVGVIGGTALGIAATR